MQKPEFRTANYLHDLHYPEATDRPELSLGSLRELVAQGEGLQVEFKRKAKFPDKIVKEIAAFANTQGGWLLIGVDDDGRIVGTESPDEEEYVMVQAITRYISPVPTISIIRIKVSGDAWVVAIWVSGAQTEGPFSVCLEPTGRDRITYVRWADESVQASRELREILKYQKRMRQVRVEIGDKERMLLKHLEKHEVITLSEFAALANIPKKVASRTLVLLALSHVLRLVPAEGEDKWYADATLLGTDTEIATTSSTLTKRT